MAASLTLKDRGEDMARVNVFLSPKPFTTPLEAFLSAKHRWVTGRFTTGINGFIECDR